MAGSMHLHSVWLATLISTGSGTNLNGMTLRTCNVQKHTLSHWHKTSAAVWTVRTWKDSKWLTNVIQWDLLAHCFIHVYGGCVSAGHALLITAAAAPAGEEKKSYLDIVHGNKTKLNYFYWKAHTSLPLTLNKPVDGHTWWLEEHGGLGAQLFGHIDTRFSWHALSPLPLFIYG